jgi:hypothetical protein
MDAALRCVFAAPDRPPQDHDESVRVSGHQAWYDALGGIWNAQYERALGGDTD